jgi:hypothetical protein
MARVKLSTSEPFSNRSHHTPGPQPESRCVLDYQWWELHGQYTHPSLAQEFGRGMRIERARSQEIMAEQERGGGDEHQGGPTDSNLARTSQARGNDQGRGGGELQQDALQRQ